MIGGTLDFRVIGENWDETLRLAASIKAGTVAPSALMRRLAAYPKQNALAKTLREIGRLERTLFTLDWISDPALRRRTNAGLNKGEARNALARAVFFHRLGEIRDRTFENQRYRASGLNLAVAAIILWNTVYLSRAVAELRSRGEIISDDLLAHVAPLGWEHITFNGDYVWPTEPLQNGFRPLRDYAGSPLVADYVADGSDNPKPHPGQRYPDWMRFGGTSHRVLVFGPVKDSEALARLEQRWSKRVEISHDPDVDPVRAGLPMGGVVLIRPDGHIGFRFPSAEASAFAALDRHLSAYLISA